MTLAIACFCAWILGGIPFGLVLVRLFKGVDIRQIGSKNTGATNASRAFAGKRRMMVFVLIYLLDFAKGFVPTWFGQELFGIEGGLEVPVVLGAFAVLGHCVSPFLGLRGGKGVATTMGVFAALELIPLLISIAVFLVVFKLTRQVFFGSLAIGITLATAVILREPDTAFSVRLPVTILALVAAVMMFVTHRSNIRKFFGATT